MRYLAVILFGGSFLTSHANTADHYVYFPDEGDYETLFVYGFEFHVKMLEELDNDRIRMQAIRKVINQIKLAVALLPERAVSMLKTNTLIRMDNNCESPGVTAWGRFTSRGVRYTTISVKCYEHIVNSVNNRALMLHEMAHAWHFQFIPDGWENQKIIEYYESVKSCLWTDEELYWQTNVKEFFAEMSTSYFFMHWNPPETRYKMPYHVRDLMKVAWKDTVSFESLDELITLVKCSN